MSDTPTETDLARDALQSELNDLDVSGALVHAVEMFVEAKIKEAASMQWAKLDEVAIPPNTWKVASASEILRSTEDIGMRNVKAVAAIVSSAILAEREAAKAEEREACAALIEAQFHPDVHPITEHAWFLARDIASSIRNRTET